MKSGGRVPAEPGALKPIGVALAAVVAGLGTGGQAKAAEAPRVDPLAPGPEHTRQHYVDPTNDPRLDEDPSLILGPSEPVAPFSTPAEQAKPKQTDLFEL